MTRVRACGLQSACTVLESMLGMRWGKGAAGVDARHRRVSTSMMWNNDGEVEHRSWLLFCWEEVRALPALLMLKGTGSDCTYTSCSTSML